MDNDERFPSFMHGATVIDFDMDGDMDIYAAGVNNGNDVIYENHGSCQYLPLPQSKASERAYTIDANNGNGAGEEPLDACHFVDTIPDLFVSRNGFHGFVLNAMSIPSNMSLLSIKVMDAG